jgi:hypothetical protein
MSTYVMVLDEEKNTIRLKRMEAALLAATENRTNYRYI